MTHFFCICRCHTLAPYNAPPVTGVMSVTTTQGAVPFFAFAGFVYPNDQKTRQENAGESHAGTQKIDLYPGERNLRAR
jgi:hypothetical protein